MNATQKTALMLRPILVIGLLVGPGFAVAQVAAPDAGSILRQTERPEPAAPRGDAPSLSVTPQAGQDIPPSAPIPVRAIRITGNTAIPGDVLHALVADAEGRSLTLPELETVAARITARYREDGYGLSRAIIPAQSIAEGVVTIQVVEARYGAIALDNDSRVRDPLLRATVAPLESGDLIRDEDLDQSLLLLSDIPGVGVDAVLKPGAAVGTSDLDIAVARRKGTFADIAIDNHGNRFVGRPRVSAALNIINPLRQGDVLTFAGTTSGKGLQYGRIGYDILATGIGTRLGIGYSALHYRLGDTVRALDANGTAEVASAWVRQPILRGRRANLSAQIGYDRKRLRDRVDAADIRTYRHLDNWTIGLNGDARDDLLGGGINVLRLGWTTGDTDFDDGTATLVDSLTARTAGRFSKVTVDATRVQYLGRHTSLRFAVVAQWSDSNLDSVEKLVIGGPYSVRGYDIGAVSADTGYTGAVELRQDLATVAGGPVQVVGFVDNAHVKVNRRPWFAGDNSVTLTGAGGGLSWNSPDGWRLDASVATRLGDRPSIVAPQGSVRGWVTIGKAF